MFNQFFIYIVCMSFVARKQQKIIYLMIKKKINTNQESQPKVVIGQNILRFQNDIKNFQQRTTTYKELPNVTLEFPKEGSINPVHIIIKPLQGFYKNSKITFIYDIPQDYPYKAPQVSCLQRVFHPNIDRYRKVCLSILKDKWQANNQLIEVIYGLWQILQGLSHLDLERPLDADAAQLMKQDPKKFQQVVEKTLKGQKHNGEEFDNVWIGK